MTAADSAATQSPDSNSAATSSQAPGPPERSLARARGPLPEAVDVAIIGCGLGGLMTAAHLARRGKRVACFDSHYTAGGCATMFARGSKSGRYHFDVGLHYIGDCGPTGQIPTMLRELGIELEYEPLDPDGFDELVFPDFRFRIPVGRDRYRDRLVAQFPTEKKGIDRYVTFLDQVHRVSQRSDAQQGKATFGLALDVLLHGRLLARYQNATVADLLDSCTDNPQLRAVMLGQSGDYGLPPSQVSAILHAGLANHYFDGAYYPRGGGQVIADRLCQVIEEHGGSIHLRRGIESILVKAGRAVGVRTESRHGESHEIRAQFVVSNADIRRTMVDLLGEEHLTGTWANKPAQWKMASALFMTFLGVRADLTALGMRRSNYWMFDTYDMEALYAATRTGDAPVAKAAYITSATLKDPHTPHHAPEGAHTIEIMSIVDGSPERWGTSAAGSVSWDYKRSDTYKERKAAIEAQLIDRLESLFPGVSQGIEYQESATPLTHSRFTRASGGTGYGLACSPDQYMRNRPGYRGPIPGLYLAGASTRAGHGIIGAMLSGRAAAHCVTKDWQ